jgi:hypothetical protein
MARWQEASQDDRYRHAHQSEPYQQQPSALDALLGTGLTHASAASGSQEDPDRPRSGAHSTARADSFEDTGPDYALASTGGSDEEPATASMAPMETADQGPWYRRAQIAFGQWRRARPFWGGLLCLLGGALMAYGPLSVFRYVLVAGTVIWAGVLIGLLVCAMGLFLWLTPQFRQIVGILAAVFSVVSLITSNLGGFILGLLLGSFGGAMGFAWTPVSSQGQQAEMGTPAQNGQHEEGPRQQARPDVNPNGPGAAAVDGRLMQRG